MTVSQLNLVSHFRFAVIAAITLSLGACANSGGDGIDLGIGPPQKPEEKIAAGSELNRALTYWGQKYIKHPTDKKAALNYAKNLKAAGHNKRAFRVLQHASAVHGNDREIASEYGRVALGQGQVALANKLLTLADDHSRPDWRIVSGRGAALAKAGKYGEAVKMFQRANQLAPANPTVLNNLAMAHAGNGNLKQAESFLRQAAENPMAKAKVNKNLALVLKLQGRNAEAANVGRSNPTSTASISPGYATPEPKLKTATKSASRRRTAKRRLRRKKTTASAAPIRRSITPTQTKSAMPVLARSTLQ